MNKSLQAVVDIVGSKRFIMFVTTLIVAAAARRGFAVDAELVAAILGLGAVLIHSQGNADHGKEAAKIVASTTTTTKVEPPGVVVETKNADVPQ